MPPRVAAITMAFNEALLLPIWAQHYARQVGADQCFIVDHGSSEDVTLPRGINRLRLPRSAHDDERRAAFISTLATGLLQYFDWVIYTDVDELVVPDPAIYRDIPAFCAAQKVGVISAIGFDVQHIPSLEPGLDTTQPIGLQRRWVRFTSAMCKPILTRQPIAWSPGFHCSQDPVTFGQIFLFHLHWADLNLGLKRVQKTRQMSWANDRFGSHQRITDREWLELFDSMAALPRLATTCFSLDAPPLREWLDRTRQSFIGREDQVFSVDLSINAAELWPIPSRFQAVF